MIKVENIVGPSPEQWAAVIRGVRNPMNSWNKSDSIMYQSCNDYESGRPMFENLTETSSAYDLGVYSCDRKEFNAISSNPINNGTLSFMLGKKDLKLMQNLANAGPDHGKFLRQLPVICEVTAPLYIWKQIDQYKVGTTTNSTSQMHTITNRYLRLDDFSFDIESASPDVRDDFEYWIQQINGLISGYNVRKEFNPKEAKETWRHIIQMLPQSFMQKRTLSLNYAVLRNMYHQRKNHKLDEWSEFLDEFINDLPYTKELIIGKD